VNPETVGYLIVLNNMIGPINLIVCATCLTLMFFESAFGICLACKIYNAFARQQAQHCPGGVCDVLTPHESQKVGAGGTAIVVAFLMLIGVVGQHWFPAAEPTPIAVTVEPVAPPADDKCTPPAFAIAMGHEEKWKLHNGCK